MVAATILTLLFASSKPQSQADQIVKLEILGKRLEDAAPTLGKALGLGNNLQISKSLRDDVVIIRSIDATQKELRDTIESTLNVTFEKKSEGWTLTQTPIQKNADSKIYQAEKMEIFSKVIIEARKAASTLKPFNQALCQDLQKRLKVLSQKDTPGGTFNQFKGVMKVDYESPLGRFASRIANKITPEFFSPCSEDRPRIVYSTKPTKMQYQLPFDISDYINLLKREQETWALYGGNEIKPEDDEPEFYVYLGQLNSLRKNLTNEDIDTITMAVNLDNKFIDLRVFNKAGDKTFNTSISTREMFSDDNKSARMDDLQSEREKLNASLTGTAKEFALLIQSKMDSNAEKKPVSNELASLLVNPETTDPLSILSPKIYAKAAGNRNIVAYVDDYAIYDPFVKLDPLETTAFLNCDTELTDRWLRSWPQNPIKARKMRMERKKLGTLLRYIQKNNRSLTIEEKSWFQAGLPWKRENAMPYSLLAALIEKSPNPDFLFLEAGYRIFGNMDETQQSVAASKGINISQLSEGAQIELYRAIFQSEDWEARITLDEEAANKLPQEEHDKLSENYFKLLDGKFSEKTFSIPTGILPSHRLTTTSERKDVIFAIQGQESKFPRSSTLTAEELGATLFKRTRPDKYKYENSAFGVIDENKLKIGTARTIILKLHLDPLHYISWDLKEEFLKDDKVYTVKTLPQEIRKRIEKAYAEAEADDKVNGALYDRLPTKNGSPPPPK